VDSYKELNRTRYEGHSEARKFQASRSRQQASAAIAHWAVRHLKHLGAPFLRVLSVGAGAGFKDRYMRDFLPGTRIHSIDIGHAQLLERKVVYEMPFNVQGDMEMLSFRRESFDAVCFFSALHHSRYTLRTLVEARSVLRLGGLVLLAEPSSLALRISGAGFDAVGDGVNFRFSLPFLKAQLGLAGFALKALETRTIAARVLVPLAGRSEPVMSAADFVDRWALSRCPIVRQMGGTALIAANAI
jgi:SAM-dependent methyltransferase